MTQKIYSQIWDNPEHDGESSSDRNTHLERELWASIVEKGGSKPSLLDNVVAFFRNLFTQ